MHDLPLVGPLYRNCKMPSYVVLLRVKSSPPTFNKKSTNIQHPLNRISSLKLFRRLGSPPDKSRPALPLPFSRSFKRSMRPEIESGKSSKRWQELSVWLYMYITVYYMFFFVKCGAPCIINYIIPLLSPSLFLDAVSPPAFTRKLLETKVAVPNSTPEVALLGHGLMGDLPPGRMWWLGNGFGIIPSSQHY